MIEQISKDTIKSNELFTILSENSIVPIIQRNYCWTSTNVKDFLSKIQFSFENNANTHPTGMISLYRNKDGLIVILDGQQRLTTLRLLLVELGCVDYLGFSVQRDDRLIGCKDFDSSLYYDRDMLKKRTTAMLLAGYGIDNMKNITPDHKTIYESKWAIRGFLEYMTDETKLKFKDYILNNLEFMLNIVYDEPMSEFLGMNSKKIKFRRYDKLRSTLLIKHGDTDEVNKILSSLSELCFRDNSIEAIKLISNRNVVNQVDCLDYFFLGSQYNHIQLTLDTSRELNRIKRIVGVMDDILSNLSNDLKTLLKWYNTVSNSTIIDIITDDTSVYNYNTLVEALINKGKSSLFHLSDMILGIVNSDEEGFEALLLPRKPKSLLPKIKLDSSELLSIRATIKDYFMVNKEETADGKLHFFS